MAGRALDRTFPLSAHLILTGLGIAAVIAAMGQNVPAGGQRLQAQAAVPTTWWGDPDLEGLWNDTYQTPLQRPARFGDREFLTDAERADIDARRGAMLGRDRRGTVKSERDVAGAYNAVFESVKPTGTRTSLVVDPPNGRVPPLTEAARVRRETYESFRLALLQATVTCKTQEAPCRGGTYGPPSPRRAERSPIYNTDRLNRADGPEDRSLAERCLQAGLPDFGAFLRIVQSKQAVSIAYDTGQGQGWQRVIPITTNPHVPSSVRQWWGDSRGRWEGSTLVVDVTNFSPKVEYAGSRDGLHLVERFTRRDADTLEYSVTIDDPATWTQSWTVKQDLQRQSARANRFYAEPRCHEGNYGLAGMFVNSRAEERAFAAGRGPDPATRDNASAGGGGGDRPEADPFQQE